jgi:ketosteroid isomerase-like protein
MSQDNVHVVLQLYSALDTGAPADLITDEVLASTFDPSVEVDQLGELVGTSGTFRGYAGLRDARRELDDALAVNRWELLEHRAEGDRVACRVRAAAVGRVSGAPVELQVGHLFSLRGGRIVRWQVFMDPAQAFAAVGPSDRPRATD